MITSKKGETDYVKIYLDYFKEARAEEAEEAYIGCTDIEPKNKEGNLILIQESMTGDIHVYKFL